LAGYIGYHWYATADKCLIFSEEIMNIHQTVCVDGTIGPSLDLQYEELIHKWMCTTDCKCYEGENNVTRDLWTGYGDEILMKYSRNDIDLYEKDDDGNITYPFIWTDDPEKAV
jgi:hypothetical protein